WGGLLGLRVLAQMPERFARIVAMSTGLPAGESFGPAFMNWRTFAMRQTELNLPAMIRTAVRGRQLSDAEAAAYGAPFPSAEDQTAALASPRLVPIRPDHPGAYDNRVAIEVLRALDLPVLLPWGREDAVTGSGEAALRSIFRNIAPPLPIAGA